MIATGAVIGLALSTASARLLASMLFGVQPLDPMTFGSVTVVLALTAAVSIVGPAWRAVRVDPCGCAARRLIGGSGYCLPVFFASSASFARAPRSMFSSE